MRIQYCSDIHLEFSMNFMYLQENRLKPVGDILILAGDILQLSYNGNIDAYFDYLSDNYRHVYWVAGNHEYYNSNYTHLIKNSTQQIRSNITIVKDFTINVDGINLIFTTLWSNISPSKELWIKSHVADFSLIQYAREDFRPKQFNELHQRSLSFLDNELTRLKKESNIVVTHHVPTLQNYPEKYKQSMLNEAFVVELDEFIMKHQPESWIYGHSHWNTPDFTMGKTKLLTNQLGYVHLEEHKSFRFDAFFEI